MLQMRKDKCRLKEVMKRDEGEDENGKAVEETDGWRNERGMGEGLGIHSAHCTMFGSMENVFRHGFLICLLSLSFSNGLKEPDYCSHDMSSRTIKPLTPAEMLIVGELKQVQVVIRHGARTPYSAHPCWINYDVDWNNCNVSEFMFSAPTGLTPDEEGWFFRKVYDASPNELGGSCQTGQLLAEGYNQEVENGNILRQAYIGNESLKLFHTSVWEDLDTSKIYFRSDDEQRTLSSGQILVHSLFDVHRREIIDWHTGDYALDTLSPNKEACPLLEILEKTAFASEEFLSVAQSKRVEQIRRELDALLGEGIWTWNYLLDCLMTVKCTGRLVPGESDGRMTQDLFDAVIAHVEYMYAYKSVYNQSYFSKLSMSKTAWNIRERLVGASEGSRNALKFVLYAGHDTTLSALLAALLGDAWRGIWPPYAALLAIEVYSAREPPTTEGVSSYFRLVYNGQPVVMTGCNNALCDLSILLRALSFGHEDTPDQCSVAIGENSVAVSTPAEGDVMLASCDDVWSTNDWLLVVVFCSLISTVAGAVLSTMIARQDSSITQVSRRKLAYTELPPYSL